MKRVAAGEGISYGLHHTFDRDATVATVPVGYADGVRRRLGLLGQEVLIGGRRSPIVGVVTMDQLMVDCGDDAVAVGDEVVLLGRQGDEEVTAPSGPSASAPSATRSPAPSAPASPATGRRVRLARVQNGDDRCMARVVLVEPYYGGSHRAWADGLIRHSRHEIHLVTHDAAYWRWRLRGSALTLAEQVARHRPGARPARRAPGQRHGPPARPARLPATGRRRPAPSPSTSTRTS